MEPPAFQGPPNPISGACEAARCHPSSVTWVRLCIASSPPPDVRPFLFLFYPSLFTVTQGFLYTFLPHVQLFLPSLFPAVTLIGTFFLFTRTLRFAIRVFFSTHLHQLLYISSI